MRSTIGEPPEKFQGQEAAPRMAATPYGDSKTAHDEWPSRLAAHGEQRCHRIPVWKVQAYPRAQPASRHEQLGTVDTGAMRSPGRNRHRASPRPNAPRRSENMGARKYPVYGTQKAPGVLRESKPNPKPNTGKIIRGINSMISTA